MSKAIVFYLRIFRIEQENSENGIECIVDKDFIRPKFTIIQYLFGSL